MGEGEARLCWLPPVWEAGGEVSFPENPESDESQIWQRGGVGRGLERNAVLEIVK